MSRKPVPGCSFLVKFVCEWKVTCKGFALVGDNDVRLTIVFRTAAVFDHAAPGM